MRRDFRLENLSFIPRRKQIQSLFSLKKLDITLTSKTIVFLKKNKRSSLKLSSIVIFPELLK